MNAEKTKAMTTDESVCSIALDNQNVEQVQTFTYLGSLITEAVECTKEIQA